MLLDQALDLFNNILSEGWNSKSYLFESQVSFELIIMILIIILNIITHINNMCVCIYIYIYICCWWTYSQIPIYAIAERGSIHICQVAKYSSLRLSSRHWGFEFLHACISWAKCWFAFFQRTILCIWMRPISLLTLSLLTLLDSNFPGDSLGTWEFHPFKIKIVLESNPLISTTLAGRLGVLRIAVLQTSVRKIPK